MKSPSEIRQSALRTLRLEAEGIGAMAGRIGESFSDAVSTIADCNGRVVITGIGKSAIIAQKIVATLNSTGTPAIFMHAADAIHGDLGMIGDGDVVICISKSGNTPEIKVLAPLLKRGGNKLIALVGNTNSYLSSRADLVLDTSVDTEACPHNLAPTTSTTAQLAMGDALAVALLEYREFSTEDFARFHPGGSLGKKLYLTVGEIAAGNEKPEVDPDTPVPQVLVEITRNRLGATAITQNGSVTGIVTDGDIRRMIEQQHDFDKLMAQDIMSAHPKTLEKTELAVNALEMMRMNNISQVIITEEKQYFGMVHLHDLLKEGIL